MPLPAAMALSGLGEDQFGSELKYLYDHGAKLLQPLNSSFTNTHSNCWDKSSAQRSTSMESGIAIVSGPSSSGEGAGPSTATSPGAPETKPAPAAASGASNAGTYWDFLNQLDDVMLEQLRPVGSRSASRWMPSEQALPPRPQSASTPTPEPQAMYQNRNILDLGAHLRDSVNSWNFQQAALPRNLTREEVSENSVYSRVYVPSGQRTYIRTGTNGRLTRTHLYKLGHTLDVSKLHQRENILEGEFMIPSRVEMCRSPECMFETPHYQDEDEKLKRT